MKVFTEKRVWQKILMALLVFIMLFQFIAPNLSFADDDDQNSFWSHPIKSIGNAIKNALADIGKKLLVGMSRVVAAIGDLIEGALNNMMLDTDGFGSAMISIDAIGKGSWFDPQDGIATESGSGDIDVKQEKYKNGNRTVVYVSSDYIEDKPILTQSDGWEIPNMLYCPENIFGNNIAMLDVNFLNPNVYQDVNKKDGKKESIGVSLHETIKSWYLAFRNIAIVSLLSILVYLGIRIILSSTAEDKAKYKETIIDWLIALCLVFVMHFIMSMTIMVVNRINQLFNGINSNGIYVNCNNIRFKTNFMGIMRFLAQANEDHVFDAWAYTIIYMVLVFYTISFTIQYLKRVLYIAFYTMISPLVAITYPIDKLGDGRSQAFNKWLKEYIMTMVLQPIHLILYTMLVSTSLSLSVKSPIYGIIAIGFLIPAEKFIKSLFGVESIADGGMGAFANGALTMKAFDMMRKPIGLRKGESGGRDKSSNGSEDNSKIRQKSNKELESFKNEDYNNEENENTNDNDNVINSFANGAAEGAGMMAGAAAANELGAGQEENIRMEDGNQGEDPNAALNPGGEESGTENTETENTGNDNNGGQDSSIDQGGQQEKLNAGVNVSPDERYDNIRRIRRHQWAKRQGLRAIKGIAKGAYKGARFTGRNGLRALGAGIAGSVGIAAGIASGKGISGAFQYGLAGAAAGSALGNNVSSIVGKGTDLAIKGAKKVPGIYHTVKENQMKDLENAGKLEELEKIKKKRASNTGMKYNDMINEYSLKTGQNFSSAEKEQLKERIYDYDQNRGITDKEKIFTGLDLLHEHTGGYEDENMHDHIADVMQMTDKYDESYFTDEKKAQQLDNKLNSKGFNENTKNNIKELLYEANFGTKGATYQEFMKQQQKPEKVEKPKTETKSKSAQSSNKDQTEAPKGTEVVKKKKRPTLTDLSGTSKPDNTTKQ